MQEALFTILDQQPLSPDVMRLTLAGDTQSIHNPGQFVNIRLDGLFLRRPLSVCDWAEGRLTLLYRVVGQGTAKMAGLQPGARLSLLCGLGNGFALCKAGDHPLLLGGGLGVAPLYGLCRRLLAGGKAPIVVLGFRSAAEAVFVEEFRALSGPPGGASGADVHVATEDGSLGQRGFVTQVMAGLDYSFFYACGPEPMFRAIARAAKTPGQYSFEARMGCGFGACMGCSCETLAGAKRICKEGPVMESGEIQWES